MRSVFRNLRLTTIGLVSYTMLLFGCGQAMLSDEHLANRSKKEFVKMKQKETISSNASHQASQTHWAHLFEKPQIPTPFQAGPPEQPPLFSPRSP